MKLKTILFSILLLFLTFSLSAQTDPGWQWAQRGGSAATFDFGSTRFDYGMERILDVAVDSDNNYYYLAEVAGYTFTLGDMEFETYNDLPGERDIFAFSTDSEGTYRWGKEIGGGSNDVASAIGVDGQDNVYISGNTINTDPNTTAYDTPVHFDTDSIMDPGTPDPGPNNKKSFLIKYDSDGNFQWLRQPEGEDAPRGLSGGFVKTVVEANGHTHSLVWFGVGTHLNGQLTVEGDFGEFIFKAVIVNYDENGALLDFIPLEMQPEFSGFYKYQMAYDPNLDRYYIADTYRYTPDPDNPLGINGYGSEVAVDKGFYLAAVNNQGEVLWYQENHKPGSWRLGDVKLDGMGNVYLTGWASANGGADSFAGYDFDPQGSGSGKQDPFLVKLNPDGNLLWGTNPDLYSPFPGQSIVINGDNVYLGLGSLENYWGDIYVPGPGQGAGLTPDIAIMRFNAQTGAAQEVVHDQNTPTQDAIMAMALDHNGDLVTGGYFGSTLFAGTSYQLSDNASDSDFFIAKYFTNMGLGTKKTAQAPIKVYPNPTTGMLNVQGETNLASYELFDLQGRLVQQGKLQTAQIDLSGIGNGLYILRVHGKQGSVENIKVVKAP